jgi:hypothetical protein
MPFHSIILFHSDQVKANVRKSILKLIISLKYYLGNEPALFAPLCILASHLSFQFVHCVCVCVVHKTTVVYFEVFSSSPDSNCPACADVILF